MATLRKLAADRAEGASFRFEAMPLHDRLPRFRDHVLPVLGLRRTRPVLPGKKDAPDQLVPADVVEVHDHDVQRALPYLLPRHVEREGLVEDGVQRHLEDGRLALLDALVPELQPHLDVRI